MPGAWQLGLAGVGIAHSPSPQLHRQLLDLAGLSGNSRLLDGVPWPQVEAMLRQGFLSGVSVTTPYKQLAAAAIDAWPDAVRPTSVNTLWYRENRLWGTSTDGPGLTATLPALAWPQQRVWLLGTGGAAVALATEFTRRGAHVAVTGRNPEQASALAHPLAAQVVPWGESLPAATVVVHASRWGHAQVGRPTDSTWGWLPWQTWQYNPIYLLDIVYRRDGPTWFEQLATSSQVPLAQADLPGLWLGAGLQMLLAQAALAFAHITGRQIDWRRLTTNT